MRNVVRLAGLLSIPMFVACAATTADDTPGDTPPNDDIMSADLPGERAEPSAGINPQRHPELWRRPADAPDDEPAPETDASAPPAPPPASPPPAIPATPVPFRGVNLAGGEFGSAIPGKFGTDYTFPTNAEVDYYMGKGMNTFRIGFRWERMQAAAYGALDATYLSRLESIVSYATSKGATVILNPHNFARYYGATVGSSQVPSAVFADFWRRLAVKFGPDARVMFNLVNEPHDMPTEEWLDAANAAIAAIRAAGATNVIVVPGNAWTGAHAWSSSSYGTSNAVAMLKIADPRDNVVFEVHQYLDSDSSGTSSTCVSATIGTERLANFIDWLRKNGKKGFVGEFAGADNATCKAAVNDMLKTLHGASDVIVGWTWWAGGPWWGDYLFTLDPKNGADRPQMGLLAPYLGTSL